MRLRTALVALLGLVCLAPAARGADAAPAGPPPPVLQGLRAKAETDRLVRALGSDDDAERLRALAEGKGVMRRDFKAGVCACLNHPNPKVRAAALQAVLPCRATDGFVALAESLAERFPGTDDWQHDVGEGSTELRYPAGDVITTYAQMGDAPILVLEAKLRAEDPLVRYAAVTALGRTRNPAVLPALAAMLSDPDPTVRRRAVRALGFVGTKPALDAVAALDAGSDEEMLKEIATALSAHGDPRGAPIWRRLMAEGVGEYSGYGSARWLARLPFAEAVPALMSGLEHDQWYVRMQCNDQLKALTCRDFGFDPGKPGAPDNPLDRANAAARWRAWWRADGRKERWEVLLDALDGPRSGAALMALVQLGDTRAIPGLLDRWGNRDLRGETSNETADAAWAVRILSARALGDEAAFRKWWAQSAGKLPRLSPLVAPLSPLAPVAEVAILPNAEHVSVDGSLAFVGARGGIEIYDVSRPANPELLGRHASAGTAVEQIHARRGRLFVTWHEKGLEVYRYSPEGDLSMVSRHDEVPRAGHFEASDRRLVAGNGRAVALYDISADGPPRLLDCVDYETVRPFVVTGERGFATSADWSGEKIVTDGRVPIAARVWPDGAAAIEGNRFVGLETGLLVVRDLGTGRALGAAPARARYDGVVRVKGRLAWTILDEMGIVVYDLSDPGRIEVLSHTPLAGQPRDATFRGLDVTGSHLFAVSYEGRLLVFALPPGLAPARDAPR